RYRQQLPQNVAANRRPRAQAALSRPKQPSSLLRAQRKPVPLQDSLRKLASIRQFRDVSVSNHPNLGIRHQDWNHPTQFLRCPPITAMKKRRHFTAALRYSCVERRCLPAILFVEVPYFRAELADDLPGAIRRPVIHYYDFSVTRRKILLQHADNGLLDKLFV